MCVHNIRCARTSALPGRPCAVGLVQVVISKFRIMDNLDAAAEAAAAAVAAAAIAAAANSCPAAA